MARKQQDQPQYRPVYPTETQKNPVYRDPDDWTIYPEDPYDRENTGRFSAPGPYYPPERQSWARGGTPRKRRNLEVWTATAVISAALLGLMIYYLFTLYQPYQPFRQKVKLVQQETFAEGVVVDGVHIGGMTRSQARNVLQQGHQQQEGNLHITLQVDDQTWVLTQEQLPFQRNIEATLDTAYAIGRQGSKETLSSSVTPMEYRYAHRYHTAENGAYLYTHVTYDPATVRSLVGIIESWINREPVDSQIYSFDFSTRTFTFTQDQTGARLDGEALSNLIQDALDRKDYQAVISVSSTPLMPAVTRVELMNSFTLISSFTTETTSDANRNTNVNLACQAVNRAVLPGETFSFNEATGQRTEQKGYLPAAAIAGGTTVDEVGGGVCQVSSTLFNAAVMADMTIVERYPHAWPSNYVDKGRDATVNWPNLDFKFRNDGNTPIFIVAYYQNRKCTVEIYGANLGPGEGRQLYTQVVDTTYPPQEPLYEQNPLLPPGTIQEKKKARTGYIVETYKVYLRNGQEYYRERLFESNYKMIQQVLEWN